MDPMTVPSFQNPRMVVSCAEEYHDPSHPRDTLDYLDFLNQLGNPARKRTPPQGEQLRLILDDYLRTWGRMARVLGSSKDDKSKVRQGLEFALQREWSEIQSLSHWTIERVPNKSCLTSLERVFDGLLESWRGLGTVNSKVRKSPVAVGKLLHIILPDLCVIWDNRYVLDNWFESEGGKKEWFPPTGQGYARYVALKAQQLASVSKKIGASSKIAGRRLERLHMAKVRRMVEGIPPGRVEPITKILDELNYLAIA